MSKSDFFGLMRHPKWQRRRLEMFELCSYSCNQCHSDSTELHVHHRIYRANSKPWEYEDHELAVLCKPCHEKETQRVRILREVFFIDGYHQIVDAMADSISQGSVELITRRQKLLSEAYGKTSSMCEEELSCLIEFIDEICSQRPPSPFMGGLN